MRNDARANAPRLIITGERRGPGRPKAAEPMVRKSVRLPPAYWTRLQELANLRQEDLSSTVRALLVFRLR